MEKSFFQITVLPGDGIGPEVIAEAVKVLHSIKERFGLDFRLTTHLIGGAALKATGVPLPPDTLEIALHSDAVLLGAVGAPEFDQNPPYLKPESALLQLRKKLEAFANLRPVVLHPPLIGASPVRREIVEGTDLLIVRELTGGLYFGEPRGIESTEAGSESAWNTMRYSTYEIQRIARIAFEAARKRRKKLHSIDKANVLETSQLWRKVVHQLSADYPDVRLEHLYVDNCAMQLISNPKQFDVILTENLFGDILSDEAAILTGSIGMLPSASIGGKIGLYEPAHGSAPRIAGTGKANPLAAIASVAMMLRYSFGMEKQAAAIDEAIAEVLRQGYRTPDIHAGVGKLVTTDEMGSLVAALL
jgi:3-isopropylmalate dehydrogenase